MRIVAGTSGWQYKEWRGSLYPEGLPAEKMLPYYASRFGAVEVNNTFYRMPRESVLQAWADCVPDGFTFILKASQRITHYGRLKESAIEPLGYMLRTAACLGDRLGPFLFQLPPNLKKDVPRLSAFLEHVPPGTRAAWEFRHPSWLDDEVLETLRAREMALCVTSSEEDETPLHATARYGYLRLRKQAYEAGELEDWADRINAQVWEEAYVFFKHEDEGTGPRLAARFMEICGSERA
jgi:uncharacterized protein YecE (DUF72 family)